MAPPATRLTLDEYLALDAASPEKVEFVNGEVVAMTGVTEAHSIVRGNVVAALGSRLHGKKPCRVHGPDLRVTISETGLYAYPDVVVVCGQPEWAPTRPESLRNPKLLLEVLSHSTADYDVGAKTAHYRLRASVDGIVHVDSRARLGRRLEPRRPLRVAGGHLHRRRGGGGGGRRAGAHGRVLRGLDGPRARRRHPEGALPSVGPACRPGV